MTAFASKGGGGGAFCEDDIAPTLSAHGDEEGGQPPAIAYTLGSNERNRSQGPANYVFNWQSGGGVRHGLGDMPTALSKEQTPALFNGSSVRRLTPTECCRLQGFPDDWLGPPNLPPDSPRYAALGDAVTVNVAHWIGLRIMEAERAMARSAA